MNRKPNWVSGVLLLGCSQGCHPCVDSDQGLVEAHPLGHEPWSSAPYHMGYSMGLLIRQQVVPPKDGPEEKALGSTSSKEQSWSPHPHWLLRSSPAKLLGMAYTGAWMWASITTNTPDMTHQLSGLGLNLFKRRDLSGGISWPSACLLRGSAGAILSLDLNLASSCKKKVTVVQIGDLIISSLGSIWQFLFPLPFQHSQLP